MAEEHTHAPQTASENEAETVPAFSHKLVQYLHADCFAPIAPIRTGYDAEHDDMTEVSHVIIASPKSVTLDEICPRCHQGFHLADSVVCYVYRYN